MARADEHRRELLGYCYRFLGSASEAEDAVQETMVRAWKAADRFEERSSMKTWMHRIATNVCLDMRKAPQRRALPMDLAGPGSLAGDELNLTTLPPETWVGPIRSDRLIDDPADAAALRDSVGLAFLAALQRLPPMQRGVVVLRDVLSWSAAECADAFDTSVASVNGALARGRRTLAESGDVVSARPSDPDEAQVVAQYVAAFEAYDIDGLVALLADDVVFSMPPYEFWLCGARHVEQWWRGPGEVCRGSLAVVTSANQRPAVGVYHPTGEESWEPFALHVLDIADGRLAAITHFMGSKVFSEFGLPEVLDSAAR